MGLRILLMGWRVPTGWSVGRWRAPKLLAAVTAVSVIGLVFHNPAGAATLNILGGSATNQTTLGALPTLFNPLTSSPDLSATTQITYFTLTMNPVTQGLFVSGQNVTLTFDFVGKEAAYTNLAVSLGTTLFSNNVTAGTLGATASELFDPPSGSALVPFTFVSTHYNPDRYAINGGTIKSSLGIAFACVSLQTCYAFFDDGGGGVDRDWDDMVVRITALDDPAATPLPATLPLFAGGLGVIALLARRKKRKAPPRPSA